MLKATNMYGQQLLKKKKKSQKEGKPLADTTHVAFETFFFGFCLCFGK